mgnify:FL=1
MNVWHEKIQKQKNKPFNIIVSSVEEGFPDHWHKEIEIVYIMEGSMEIGLGNQVYVMQPRDLLFIGSCDIHRYYANPLGCAKIIVQLDHSVFDGYSDYVFGRRFAEQHLTPAGSLHAEFERSMRGIYEEWTERTAGYELAVKAKLNELLAAMIRRLPMLPYSADEKTKRLEQLERLDNVFKYIESSYDTEITLKSAADICGFSVYYFSRFFKEATGSSFVDYVHAYRTEAAMFLLRSEASFSITDIAYRTGFNSIETFNRVFKKMNGFTPSAFRSKI